VRANKDSTFPALPCESRAVSVEIVRFAQLPSLAWKNGLGTTTQLAIHPASADQNTFDWRVSVATLTATAPFSSFPGIERRLAMLEGEVTLLRDDGSSVTLDSTSPVLMFSGDERIVGRVESGIAIDLNLMYRPSRWQATMRRVALREGMYIRSPEMTMLCAVAPGAIDLDGRRIELGRFDLLRTTKPIVELIAVTTVAAYAIELQERDR
jgi:environmental stress-induced protein Ves